MRDGSRRGARSKTSGGHGGRRSAGSAPRPWTSWVAVGAVAAIAAGVGLLVLGWLVRSSPGTEEGARPIVLVEPSGAFDTPPDRFRWEPVHGVASYLVVAQREGSEDPLFARTTETAELRLEPADLARAEPGAYQWKVEGRDRSGRVVARGEGEFRLLESP